MHSLNDVTGLLADRENVLPALRSAQVELVDCVEIFDGIGVEPARKELKKLFDRGGVHDVWNAGGFQVDTGSRGAAAPGLLLVSERDCRGTATRAEKVFGERLDNGRVIALATENVEIGAVRIVCEMAADQRSRDQLHHGITSDAT